MAAVATTIRIPARLQERYDQLAKAAGRTRNDLMAEALERYVAREGWQIEQACATLDRAVSARNFGDGVDAVDAGDGQRGMVSARALSTHANREERKRDQADTASRSNGNGS